ncbi:zinc finger protein 729-like [Pectinophora gossypiella]|nr:zinc finger protein 729-like [Pectinophora gossypiella]
MSDLKICRICLRTQCKVYRFDRYQLKHYYEEVTAVKVNDKDGLPHFFCYECATMLHKFHKFKEKCYNGQNTLKEIGWRGPITYEAIYKIDRALRQLKSPLEILTVTKRVKTYVTTDIAEASNSESESIHAEDEKEINIKDIEDCKDVFLDEGSIADDNFDSECIAIDEDSKNILLANDVSTEVDKKMDFFINNSQTRRKDKETPIPSPKTVFVDIKKDVITLKNEPFKERKRYAGEFGLKKQNPKQTKKRTRYLDSENWKKYTLSEEDAVKEFQMKAKSPKYDSAAFKCGDCYKGFSKEDMLKRHKQLRHSESLGPLECRFCHMRFKWDCKLRKHMRQHFTRYVCLLCNLRCSVENTAIMHEDYHKGVIKKCIHCGEEFKHSSTYYTHLRTHRSEYVCTLCGMSFVSPSGLHMHKKIKHINDEIDSPDDDEEVNTFCEKCDITFETRKAYEEHLFHSAMHTEGLEDELDEFSVPRKVLGKKLQAKITHSLKKKTPLPEELVRTAKKRRKNKRRCHKKPTTCHQCGKHFDTQAACMKHHLAEHPRTSFFPAHERHICEICGASLAPGSVAMHQNIHSKQKMFPCETCGKTFHSSIGVRRHMVTHTGEKPFACTLCDKRFTQSNSMKLHYRTFHLKQPYPKRNRRKKKDDIPTAEDNKTSSEESEASLPDAAPAPAPLQDAHDTIHYLTLS